MMRAGGGSNRNHRSPPRPPSPPPPPPPNPSSSSTLSPLARPFTLGHVVSSPSPPLPVPDRPSATRLPSHTTAASTLRSQPTTGAIGDPYYARYYPKSQPRAIDDPFRPSPAHSGVGAGPWNRPFDEEVGRGKRTDAVSSWTEPSPSYKVPPFQEELAADGHSYYDTDSYGVWHGKFADSLTGKVHFGSQSSKWLQDKHTENYEPDMASSYTIFSAPFAAPSALLDGIHCSGATGSTSGMGSHDTFVSNSSYDRYMAQLDSCSVNPLVFYPSAPSSTSNQVYAPSNLRASSNINSALSYAAVLHEVPYKINEPLIIPSNPKEPNLDHNFGSKGGYDEKREDYNITKSTVSPSRFVKGFPSGNNTASESSSNISAVWNPGLGLENLVIADAAPSTCSSVEPDKSVKGSSEALDQHNLAVDSPCWKGAPASRQSPFTFDEMLIVQTAIEESKDFNDPCQDQKHLFEGVGNSKSPAEQVGNLIFDENKKSSISEKPQCSSVVSSSIHQKPENAIKKLSDHRKVDRENEILCDDVHREEMNETTEVEKRDSEVQVVGAAKFVETERIAVNIFPPAKGIDDSREGSCSSPQKNINELVKAMHCSSIELLSTNLSGDNELEPHDCRLLYSVINNIVLVLKDKKGCVGCNPHCSGLETAWSCIRCLKTEDVNQSNMSHACNMKGKFHSVGCNIVNDEFDNFAVKGCDTDLRKVNGMTQAFGNALSKISSEGEENAWTLLYKNLWIEAEASTCRLKYELQLAQMKIESENLKPPQPETSSSLPFANDLQGHKSPLKAKGSLSGTVSPTLGSEGITSCQNRHEASAIHELNKSEDIQSSVMARFKVLKDRVVSSNYRSMEEQETLLDPEDTGTCSGTKENVHGSPNVANNSGVEHQPTNLADLGFTESVVQPYTKHKRMPWSSLLITRPDVQRVGATSDDEIWPGLDISGYANTREMFPGALNGSLIQSYMTYKQGNWSLTSSGHENPSFEWEHVLREESTQ